MVSDEDPEETYSGEQYLEDKEYNLEDIVLRNLDLERMRAALQLLSSKEMELITALYLSDEPLSIAAYAAKEGVGKNAIQCRKKRILEKIRKNMGATDCTND